MYVKHSSLARAFTLIEIIVVLAVIAMLTAIVVAMLTDAQLDARDKRRITDLEQIEKALNLYYVDHLTFPKESEGANGNISTNTTFQNLVGPYMQGVSLDPNAKNNSFYYYYDGAHRCGSNVVAIVFARQMNKASNANYNEFLNSTCGGVLDGEGRGGGTESYNIIIGSSGG